MQSDKSILLRAVSLCNEACFAVDLQHRRLRSTEPEDDTLRLSMVDGALGEFDEAVPGPGASKTSRPPATLLRSSSKPLRGVLP